MQKKRPGRAVAVCRCISLLATVWSMLLLQVAGCVPWPCPYQSAVLFVRGTLIEGETEQALSDAAVGGRTFTGDEETHWTPAMTSFGDPNGPPSAEDGSFQVEFRKFVTSCEPLVIEFPRPDQVEIIVVRDGCEQTFLIDINEDTALDVVDPDFPRDDVIELKDPILVPPCQE